MPYTVKVNGVITDEWCVGDLVLVTYDEWYTDDGQRMECNLIKIEESDFELNPVKAYKPVIYLYPEQKTDAAVKLGLNGQLTCTYPAYKNGWQVTSFPNGKLKDKSGQDYNYLYWEGKTYTQWDMSKGFCVKGEDTAVFLETALAKLGLNRTEANEFIVYRLPLMQENPYNIISFQTEAYTNAVQLNVTPKPDTVIRVFMVYSPSKEKVDIEPQALTSPTRTGFTVVEWGGTEN